MNVGKTLAGAAVIGCVAVLFFFPGIITVVILPTVSLAGSLIIQSASAPRIFTGPLWVNLLWDVAFGACVGLVVGLIRYVIKWKNGKVEALLSASASRKVVTASQLGLTAVLVHIIIGAASGLAIGSLGLFGPAQLQMNTFEESFHSAPAGIALVAVGVLGGAGGGGPPPGLGAFIVAWLAVFLAAVVLSVLLSMLLTALINGAAVTAVGEAALSGAVKGAGKRVGLAITTAAVRLWAQDKTTRSDFGSALLAGLVTGALTGALTTIIALVCVYVADKRAYAGYGAAMQVTEIARLRRHKTAVTTLKLSPDGKYLLSIDRDGKFKIWSSETRKLLLSVEVKSRGQSPVSRFNSAAFDRRGDMLVAGATDGTVHLWKQGRELPFLVSYEDSSEPEYASRREVQSTAFSPDGRLLAAGWQIGRITVWDVRSLRELRQLSIGSGDVIFVGFPNKDRLISIDSYGYLKLWDIATGAELDHASRQIQIPSGFSSAQLTSDGKFLAVMGDGNVSLSTVNEQVKAVSSFTHNGVSAICFRPDGRVVASGAADGTIRLWVISNARDVSNIPPQQSPITALAFNADGTLLVSGHENGEIKLWSVRWSL